MFRRRRVTALAISVTRLGASTTTTTPTSTWAVPDAQAISPSGESIGVVFFTGEERLRRTGGNSLAAIFPPEARVGLGATTYSRPLRIRVSRARQLARG